MKNMRAKKEPTKKKRGGGKEKGEVVGIIVGNRRRGRFG